MIFWFLGFGFLLLVAFYVIFFRSKWFFGRRRRITIAEKCTYLGALFGGILLVFNALYMSQSNNLMRKGQLDTRFKDAATLLSAGNSSAELSAIHSLYQIAIEASQTNDRKDYVQVIKHILTGFIKDNSVIKKDTAAFNKKSDLLLQTIINYLFSENYQYHIFEVYPTDLQRTVLKNIDFKYTQLQGADFWNAQLQDADFSYAQLQGADFRNAQLQDANFDKAQLQSAYFINAQLQGANFSEVNLRGANFRKAQIQGAYFRFTEFKGAIFDSTSWDLETNFRGTVFEGKSIEELTEIMGRPPEP